MYAIIVLVIILMLVAIVGVISCGVLEWYISGKLRKNIASGGNPAKKAGPDDDSFTVSNPSATSGKQITASTDAAGGAASKGTEEEKEEAKAIE